MKSGKTKELVLCAMFVALIAAGAFIKIPIPVVPFTLQYLFTMMAGLPIFAQGGGPAYIFQPSFGYLIGFAAGAYVTGVIAGRTERPGYGSLLAANFAGLAIVYLFGMVYYYFMSNFYLNSPIGLWPLFLYCFILAVPGDIALCIVGAILGKRLIPLVKEKERAVYDQT